MSTVADAVTDYLNHARAERGLAPNTVAAYRRDLNAYAAFLAGRGIEDIGEVTPVEISEYVRELGASQARSSVARHVVSIRTLHRFAAAEGLAPDDPTADVSPPKLEQRLPKALSVDEVTRILEAPDRGEVVGLRDAALLELLYGTGARVSEVCGLDVDEVDRRPRRARDAGLRLLGKGGKERVVPLGSYAARGAGGLPGAVAAGAGAGGRGTTRRCCSTSAGDGSAASRPGRCCRASRARRASPPTCPRTHCGTRSPPTCSTAARTCAWCRNCSATRPWRPRRSTRWSPSSTSARSMRAAAHPRAR